MKILLNDELISNCGSKDYKIAIPAQQQFIKIIKQPLQYSIDTETTIEKHDDITRMSNIFFNNFIDIGTSVMVPSEVFTNLNYDKIDQMLIDFKNGICQELKNKKIFYYGDVQMWCDESVHKGKQVGIYGWCEGCATKTNRKMTELIPSYQ